MINHLRTLLLNLNGTDVPGASYPGEEFVPAEFRAMNLPDNLAAPLTALFGSKADRAAKNVMLRQVLSLIHGTELASYATDLDPRITYWPPHDDFLFRGLVFGAAAKQTSGTNTSIYLQGEARVIAGGTLYQQWSVVVTGASTATISRLTAPTSSTDVTFTSSGELTEPITLPGSSLLFRFIVTGAPHPSWTITALARPTNTLVGSYNAIQLAGADNLFLGKEPYRSLLPLYQDLRNPIPYRLGAAVLALGYRLDAWYRDTTA